MASLTIFVLFAVAIGLTYGDRKVTLSHHAEQVTETQKPSSAKTSSVPLKHDKFQFLEHELPENHPERARRLTLIQPPLQLYQSYPDLLVTKVVGPVTNPIYPGTPAFNALELNYNGNPAIYWGNTTSSSYPQLGSKRLRNLVDILAGYVTQYFNYTVPIHLVVLTSYIVPPTPATFPDMRYEARGVTISVQAQGAAYHTAVASNLQFLASLAYDAGFQFVQFYAVDYLFVATLPDGCQSNLDLAFLLDGSGSVGQAGFTQALSFISALTSYFTIGPDQTRVGLVTYDGWRTSNYALEANSSNCPLGSTWDANGQGCICPANAQCNGPQYNQFFGPYSGCRAGQFEVTPGACAGSNQPGWVPADHPDCQYPREFFDFNCTTCACSPWGPAFQPSYGSQTSLLFSGSSSASTVQSIVTNVTYPNGGSMLSLGLGAIMNQVFNTSNGMRPASAGFPRVLVVLSDGKSQYQFGPDPIIEQIKSNLGVTVFAIGIGSPYLPELIDIASSPSQQYVFTSPDISQLPTLLSQLSTGVCTSNNNAVTGGTINANLTVGTTSFFQATCPVGVTNMIITLLDLTGTSQLFISTNNANPSIAQNTQSDTSTNVVKTITVNRGPAASLYPVYIGISDPTTSLVNTTYQLTVTQGVFTYPTQTFSVPQTNVIGTNIDTFPNMQIPFGYTPNYQFSLSSYGNSAGYFTINATTGQLSLAKIPVYSQGTTFTLIRYATDATVTCLTGSQAVNVTFYDNTDFPPVFNPTVYSANFAQLVDPGYSSRRRSTTVTFPYKLTQVHATAAGTGINAQVSYFLLNGDPTLFSVDPNNGTVYLLQNLIFSVAPSYFFQVGARSGGGAATNMGTSANVTVTVLFTPQPPYISAPFGPGGDVPVSSPTNPTNGTVIATLPVANPDNLTFTCVAVGVGNLFAASVVGSSCVITTTGPLNPTTTTTYLVNVTVVSGNYSSPIPVAVTVPGHSNVLPEFHPSTLSVFVALNEPIASIVVSLNVTDGTNIPACNITSGNDDGIYTINQLGTCVISIAVSPLDADPSLSNNNVPAILYVEAFDGFNTAQATVTITYYDGCSPMSCRAGFACPMYASDYNCVCINPTVNLPPCFNNVNYCASASQGTGNPCAYGSTCKNTPTSFVCSCLPGLTGPTCDVAIDYCASASVCSGVNGVCTRTPSAPGLPLNSYYCTCAQGFFGQNCQYNDPSPNLCLENPCDHGTCTRTATVPYGPLNNYTCTCQGGYFGVNCTESISSCPACVTGFTCVPSVSGGYCDCGQYYEGDRCQTLVPDACTTLMPCQNGGSCSRATSTPGGVFDSYTCQCPTDQGWSGQNCTDSNTLCNGTDPSFTCDNGSCQPSINGGYCVCSPCFTGDTCSVALKTGSCASADSASSTNPAVIVVPIVVGVVLIVVVALLLVRYKRTSKFITPAEVTAVSLNTVPPADSLSNPMYGMVGQNSSTYDSIVTPSQTKYDGVAPARDGGYMTVVRPQTAEGGSNPMYGQLGASQQGNYDSQPAIANQQFAIEQGRLRVASVARVNPLNGETSLDNPMYHHGNNGNNSAYDTPQGVFDEGYLAVGPSTTQDFSA